MSERDELTEILERDDFRQYGVDVKTLLDTPIEELRAV